ncbi:hypothetical protein [Pseudomonas putida]
MPIHDAIRQLEAKGLVTPKPHKGAVLSVVTIES